MGWGRYFLLGDLGQQLDLADQKVEIERLRNEIQQTRGAASFAADYRQLQNGNADASFEFHQLRNEHDELKLYLAALIRLLVSKGAVTKEEIQELVTVIDEEDGCADGRMDGPANG